MKITLKNGDHVLLKLRYEYSAGDIRGIKALLFVREKYEETIRALRMISFESPSDDEKNTLASIGTLIDFYTNEIRSVKGAISEMRRFPVKTYATLKWNAMEYEAFSSISKGDAKMYMHSRKLGRKSAIRNVLALIPSVKYEDGVAVMPLEIRQELATKLLPFIVDEKPVEFSPCFC